MISSVVLTVGLLAQLASNTQVANATLLPDSTRVWRTDSMLYVTLQGPGHLLVMHVDAIGRIQVLYPLVPDDSFPVSNDMPTTISLPPTAEGNPATFLAVRSRWPFDFSSVRWGSWWNYRDALLLQPTGGDPLAALLDIADRVTDGRPYDFGVMLYARDGAASTRRTPVQPDVCLGCVRQRLPAPAPTTAAVNSADCSNSSLTNSFCGANSGSVSITSAPPPQVIYVQAPPPASGGASVVLPYYWPNAHGFRPPFQRFPIVAPPVVPMSQGVASPIAPRVVVPTAAQLGGRSH